MTNLRLRQNVEILKKASFHCKQNDRTPSVPFVETALVNLNTDFFVFAYFSMIDTTNMVTKQNFLRVSF